MPTESLQPKRTTKDKTYFGELLQLFNALYNDTVTHAIHHTKKLQSEYETYRNTACYHSIKQDMANNTPVTAAEYLFYALVTDNVSTLDPNKLDQHNEIQLKLNTPHIPQIAKAIRPFVVNLKILAAALRHQENPSIETLTTLRELLDQRARLYNGNNELTRLYLNLNGITLVAIRFQPPLNFHHCYFAEATLDRELSFNALGCLFHKSNMDTDINCKRTYVDCDLIEVTGRIWVPTYCTFKNSKIIRSHLNFTAREGLYFIDCTISASKLTIDGTCDAEVAGLSSCNVHRSSITFGYGRLRWCNNTITQSLISSNPRHSAKHIFDGEHVLCSNDLRKAQIDDLITLLHTENLSIHEPSLIYDYDLFETPQAFNQLLTDIRAAIWKEISRRFDFTLLAHKDAEEIQVVYAKLIIAHIHAYYPTESFPLEAIALLEEALKHTAFQNLHDIGMKSTFGSLFAACSTATKARKALSEALDDALTAQSQHTALSRLASF